MRIVVILSLAVILTGCDAWMHTSDDVAEIDRRRDAERERTAAAKRQQDALNAQARRETEMVDKLCSTSPLTGEVRSFEIVLSAKRQDLKEAQGRLSIATRRELGQKLDGYAVQWEILNREWSAACKAHALCQARNQNTGFCADAFQKYMQALEEAHAFVLEVMKVDVPKN